MRLALLGEHGGSLNPPHPPSTHAEDPPAGEATRRALPAVGTHAACRRYAAAEQRHAVEAVQRLSKLGDSNARRAISERVGPEVADGLEGRV
jgi:hypothetical protein